MASVFRKVWFAGLGLVGLVWFANAMQDMWKTQNVKCKVTTSTAGPSKNLRALPTAN